MRRKEKWFNQYDWCPDQFKPLIKMGYHDVNGLHRSSWSSRRLNKVQAWMKRKGRKIRIR